MERGTPLPRFTGRPSKAERRPILRFLGAKLRLRDSEAPAPLGWGTGQGTPPPTPPGGGGVEPWSLQPASKPRVAGKPYTACWVPALVGR